MKNVSPKRIKSIIRITLIVLVAIIVGVNLYLINAQRLAGDSVPMPFGVGVAVVLSGSMEPELSTGDLLLVAERESYNVGDVVVFQDRKVAVTHRIISMDGDTVITKGDANNTEDSPINLSQIKGQVILAIPFVGYIANILKNPICTLCILALAIWLLERSFANEKQQNDEALMNIKKEIEKMKNEQK